MRLLLVILVLTPMLGAITIDYSPKRVTVTTSYSCSQPDELCNYDQKWSIYLPAAAKFSIEIGSDRYDFRMNSLGPSCLVPDYAPEISNCITSWSFGASFGAFSPSYSGYFICEGWFANIGCYEWDQPNNFGDYNRKSSGAGVFTFEVQIMEGGSASGAFQMVNAPQTLYFTGTADLITPEPGSLFLSTAGTLLLLSAGLTRRTLRRARQ